MYAIQTTDQTITVSHHHGTKIYAAWHDGEQVYYGTFSLQHLPHEAHLIDSTQPSEHDSEQDEAIYQELTSVLMSEIHKRTAEAYAHLHKFIQD